MMTIFEPAIRKELIQRVESLNENSKSAWGKMNVYQMIKHCSLWDEWILGKNNTTYKQEFIGKIFGKMALRRMTKNDKPLDKNVPTSKWLKIKETNGDLITERNKWVFLLNEYSIYSNPKFIHDFFGKMQINEIGILAYKHSDHHLRQFNA